MKAVGMMFIEQQWLWTVVEARWRQSKCDTHVGGGVNCGIVLVLQITHTHIYRANYNTSNIQPTLKRKSIHHHIVVVGNDFD